MMGLGLPLHVLAATVYRDRVVSATLPLTLSEARWTRLWTLIQCHDPAPPSCWTAETVRPLVLALLYRALTEGPWSDLPVWAPPAAHIRVTYQRWRQLGLLERLSADLAIKL